MEKREKNDKEKMLYRGDGVLDFPQALLDESIIDELEQEIKMEQDLIRLDGINDIYLREHFILTTHEEKIILHQYDYFEIQKSLLSEDDLNKFYGEDFRIKYPDGNILVVWMEDFWIRAYFIGSTIHDSYFIGESTNHKLGHILGYWKETGMVGLNA
jgi:hypothetical protein